MRDTLRRMRLEALRDRPFILEVWATDRTDRRGQTVLGYELTQRRVFSDGRSSREITGEAPLAGALNSYWARLYINPNSKLLAQEWRQDDWALNISDQYDQLPDVAVNAWRDRDEMGQRLGENRPGEVGGPNPFMTVLEESAASAHAAAVGTQGDVVERS